MNKVKKLGEIFIFEIDTENEKASSYSIVKKIRFAGETKQVGVVIDDESMTSIVDDIIYSVLYAAKEEGKRAYYQVGESLFMMDSSVANAYLVYRQVLENPDDEMEVITAVDSHFGGHGQLHIEMTPAEIRSAYGRNQNIIKYGLIGIAALAIIVLIVKQFSSEPPVVINPPPPPPPLILNDQQIVVLKDIISKHMVQKIFDDAKLIASDPFLSKHKKIKSFVLGQMDPGVGESGQYPPMIGKGEIVYEFDFPAKGTVNSGSDLFVLKSDLVEQATVPDIVPGTKEITQECIQAIHTISNIKDITVGSRQDAEIIYEFKEVKPALFLSNYLNAADLCPVYIKTMNGTDDRYSGTLVLYRSDLGSQQ